MLVQALDRLRAGPAQALAVTGEPGIGKTSLLGFLAATAGGRGLTVLAGSGREAGRGMPFGLLAAVLEDHLAELRPTLTERLRSDHLGLLGTIFPALSGYRPEACPAAGSGRYWVHAAVRALLEELAQSGLVVILDDLHWADEESAHFAAYLLRRPPRARVLLAVAYRDRQAAQWLRSAIGEALAGREVEPIMLGPLSEDEADLLLRHRGSSRWRHDLYLQSGGNPFYLRALASVPGRQPTPEPGQRADGGDELPAAVEAALLSELSSLPATARLVAQSCAVAGEPFEPGHVAEIAGLADEAVLAAVDELADRDLIRLVTAPQGFAFRHPLVREVVYRNCAPGWRLAAHGRAAAALQRREAPAAARARHVAATAQRGDLAAVAVLTDAARDIRLRAPATAAQWLDAALELLPGGRNSPESTTLLLYLAADLGAAGHLRESRDTLHQVLRQLPSGQVSQRAKAVAFCALMDRELGRWDEAHALLASELSVLPGQRGFEAAALKLELACGELLCGDAAAARDWAARSMAAARECHARTLQVSGLGVLGIAAVFCEDTRSAVAHVNQAVPLLDSLLDSELSMRLDATGWVALSEILVDRPGNALRHLDRALSLARSSGQAMMLPYLLNARVLAQRSTGPLEDVSASTLDALDLALAADSDEQRLFAVAMQCWAASATGDLDEALRTGNAAAARLGTARGWSSGLVLRMLAETRFAARDPEGCLALVTAAGGPALPRADPWSRIGWYELLARAELAAGRHDAAEQWAARAQQGAARLGLPGRTGLALLARAHVDTARDPARALELALEAQEALTAAGMTLDAARAQLAAARARAACGETEAASRQLQQAEAVLDSLGAHHLASRGGREPAVPLPGILTRREYQVAQLVAVGLTNRRIARQLHVTDKTVEKHLSNIFAKLAISSRAALATALAQWAGRPA